MELLTITQMAERLNIPESTACYYKNKYRQFIPSVGIGRSKRYPSEALKVLRFIAEKSNRNTSMQEMESWLFSEFPAVVEVQEETNAAAPQNFFEVLTAFSETFSSQADQQGSLERIEQEIKMLRQMITAGDVRRNLNERPQGNKDIGNLSPHYLKKLVETKVA